MKSYIFSMKVTVQILKAQSDQQDCEVCNWKLMDKLERPVLFLLQNGPSYLWLSGSLKANLPFCSWFNVDICPGGVCHHHNRGIRQLCPQCRGTVHLQPQRLGVSLRHWNRSDCLPGMCGLPGAGRLLAFHEQRSGEKVRRHGRPGILRWARA